jgi:hypothetical protein
MKKQIWTYGISIGISVAVLMYLTFFMWMGDNPDYSMGEIAGYTSMLLSFALLFIGVKQYRDKQLGGYISFKKAFLMGLLMTLIASAIYVIGWMIYSSYNMTDFMDQYTANMLENLAKEGASTAEIQAKREEMAYFAELYKNPFWKAVITFTEIFPVGLIISLISALILKRKSR